MESKVTWASTKIPDAQSMSSLTHAVKKLTVRKAICEKLGLSLDRMYQEWGDVVDIRKQLFYIDQAGFMYPKTSPTIEGWKLMIRDYCQWHCISQLDQICNLWCDVIDALLSCPEYETQVDPMFRAWASMCMCKYVLEQRKYRAKHIPPPVSQPPPSLHVNTQEYNPETPGF